MARTEDDIDRLYFDCFQSLCKREKIVPGSVDRSLNLSIRKDGPKTLVCHDMKGGYLPEDGLKTVEIKEEDSNPFIYSYLWYTDIFVYFSHHFITVPTVRWINQCHDHDVLCLGTFITECATGRELCVEVFSNEDNIDSLIRHMTDLCNEFFFDGWLVNIENIVDTALIGNVALFLHKLKLALKTKVGQHSQLIWYDSIKSDGSLDWQNCLNESNVLFADIVDGFYANYAWNRFHLKQTKQYLEMEKLSIRPTDVYFGVDVFGRGSFEGGQFNTHKAVQAARNCGFSVAIFAPGWTTECFDKETYLLANHDKLFRKMSDTLYPHRLKRPFKTNFSIGFKDSKFEPSLRTVFPFLFESTFSLTNDGLHINGEKGSKHVLFLTDIRCVSRYELNYNCVDKLSINVLAQESRENFVRACQFTKRFDIWEIYCVKLTDEPVILNHLAFNFKH